MKKQLFILLALISAFLTGNAQIDYQKGMDFISTKDKVVRITWLESAPRKCKLTFDHKVSFINTTSESLTGSKVNAGLYHNGRLIKSFEFKTGEAFENQLYTTSPIMVDKGDEVYLMFQLIPATENEEYVFNVYTERKEKAVNRYIADNAAETKKVIESEEKKTRRKSSDNEIVAIKKIKRERAANTIYSMFMMLL